MYSSCKSDSNDDIKAKLKPRLFNIRKSNCFCERCGVSISSSPNLDYFLDCS